MKTFLYGPGMKVRVRRGVFPLDPTLEGRRGLVVTLDDYRPKRYGVTLEGESATREFTEDELVPEEGEALADEELGSSGPGVGPTPSGGSGGQH